MGLIIAIDGPSGTGKGALSKELIKRHGFAFLDTGILYRALGAKANRIEIPLDDEDKLAELAKTLSLMDFRDDEALRNEQVGQMASKVAVLPKVRDALMVFMRAFAQQDEKGCGVILDGRDIGTVVCPNADIKIYLNASPEVRARRRFQELQRRGQNVIFEDVLQSIKDRDHRDRHRLVAPSEPAKDAMEIDTTHMSIADVVEIVDNEISKATQ